MSRAAIEIPGDWAGRDRALEKLAKEAGFGTVNRLLSHVAYEVSYAKSPAVFYRALANFHELARRKTARKPNKTRK